MSRTGSSSTSGVRVAAEPHNNIYTVLLLIGAAALTAALIMLWGTLESRYGVTFGVSEAGKAALKAPEDEAKKQQAARAELDEKTKNLERFPANVGAAVPRDESGKPPATETPGG